ncbi:ABC transporter permease/M1 family aminopeptidase [candidate division CSSED10-310 bacterium]|uniref:ABC transporter permease/M1 family aminopeptidase n=1 Tax=candidate division CSSED10-310 bacterium TaxID=2855610 RepID=A0ABV6YW63_UNCC1
MKKILKSWPPYIFFFIFFTIAFFLIIKLGGAFGGTSLVLANSLREWTNSPLALYRYISLLNLFSLIIVAIYMGQSVLKDFEGNTYSFYFTKPITKIQYLGGRFGGTFLIMVFITTGVGFGLLVGSMMPFVKPELFGPNTAAAYIRPYLLAVIPNIFLTGALFFSLATLSRKMSPVYAGSVLLVVGYSFATDWVERLDNLTWVSILDPFGFSAEVALTRYWTIAEKNTMLIPLSGDILANRLLWIGVGLGLLIFTFFKFSFSETEYGSIAKTENALVPEQHITNKTIGLAPSFGSGYAWRVLVGMLKLEFKATVKNISFIIIVLSGVLFIFAIGTEIGEHLGTRTYPVTYATIELLGSFSLFVLIIIIFFSGELVWRERQAGMNQITDSLPTPNWVPYLAKLGALTVALFLLMVVLMVCCLTIQAYHGYFNFELEQYALNFFVIKIVWFLHLCIFGFFLHTVLNRKALSYFMILLLILLTGKVHYVGLEHYLFRLFRSPELVYSDMNGYGPFRIPYLWFNIYWSIFAIIMALVTDLLWFRGLETTLRKRFRLVRQGFTAVPRLLFMISLIFFCASAGYIYYNTNVLNEFKTIDQRRQERRDYELNYKKFASLIQPRVRDIDVELDIFPSVRSVKARGTYRLENSSEDLIKQLIVSFGGHFIDEESRKVGIFKRLEILSLQPDRPHRITLKDQALGFYVFALEQPLAPGKSMDLLFDVALENKGFPNGVSSVRVVRNGTFIANSMLLPRIGYDERVELENERLRHRFNLSPKDPLPALDYEPAHWDPFFAKDSDLISLNAIISTTADQIALTPGYLKREWQEGERRYFHYSMDRKMWNYFAFLSGKYAVKRDAWRDVAIEIYHHPGHEYNLEAMIQAVKDSLDYYTHYFGPYQHRQVRIIEFPRYSQFAESFPNTIPFSESAGFIAYVDPADEDDVDYPYYVTAHEVAHQWWGHQVCPARVEGAYFITETLACYSSIMVMKQKYGETKVRRILQFELDKYLKGRSEESREEVPLLRTTGSQPYIHYKKGVLVMYALQDYIGEDAVNKALAQFLTKVTTTATPYPTSRDLLACLKAETPPHLQYLIHDFFEQITIYDFQAAAAHATRADNGKYEVVLKVKARKLKADGLGHEQEMPLQEWVDIGVLNKNKEPLYLQKHWLKEGQATFNIMVAEKPVQAGIDPFCKLIDRCPSNNLIELGS